MRRILCLFIVMVALVAKCGGDNDLVSRNTVIRKNSNMSSIKERIINFIAKKEGYDSKGWFDISKLKSSDVQEIDLRLQNGKVVCNKGRQIVKVTVVKEEFVMSMGVKGQFLLHLNYHNLKEGSSVINPLPVIREDFVFNENGVNFAFPQGFKGYLVCTEVDEEAYLIPEYYEKLEFVEPVWQVKVDIQMFKHPLSAYGRMYKIIILDNVHVLKNRQKSFIWHVPVSSMAEVYEFHMAMENAERGKHCTLTRHSSGDVVLHCSKWRSILSTRTLNILGGASFAVLNVSVLLNLMLYPSVVYYNIDRKDPSSNGKNSEATVMFAFPLLKKNTGSDEDREVFSRYRNQQVKRAVVANAILFGVWTLMYLMMKGISYNIIVNRMRRMDKRFNEAEFAYPWKLAYVTNDVMQEKLFKHFENRRL